MSVEHFALGLLSVLLLGSNVFWARAFMSMANRLMSRSYYDFVLTEKAKDQKAVRPESKEDDFLIDPEDERQAAKLNATFGLGA
jgi:hypothetical protein